MEHIHCRLAPKILAVCGALALLASSTRAGAVSRSCGPDPLLNTDDVLCAPPSGPCTATDVTLGAGVEVTDGGCTFDLAGRALTIDATFEMAGDGFIKIVNAGGVTVTAAGKLKARGAFVQPLGFIIGGGLISIDSSGAITHDGVIDVSGDPAGVVVLRAAGDVSLQNASEIRGGGQSSQTEVGARFADGALVEIVSRTGSITVNGSVDASGQNTATGGEIILEAALDVEVAQVLDASGGGSGGGLVDIAAGDDVTITRRIDVSSRGGGGAGGAITLAAGDDDLGGVIVNGTLTLDDVALKLEGSSADGFGGDGGDLEAVSAGAIMITGTGMAIRATAGSSWLGNGGLVSLESGSDADVVLEGLVTATSSDDGGFGGGLDVLAGRDLVLGADVDLGGKDAGGVCFGIAGGTATVSGAITADATSATGAGGEVLLEACDLTVETTGRIETSGIANAASHPLIELVGRDHVVVRASSLVDAGASGEVVLRTSRLGGICSNDPTMTCQDAFDCTVGCNTGTCDDINPDTEGTTAQFSPEPSMIEEPALACGGGGAAATASAAATAVPVQAPVQVSEHASIVQGLAESGRADVVVVLREGATVAQRGPTGASARAALRSRQDAVLGALPAGALQLRRQYSHLNGFAGSVDEAGYLALLADPRVARVYRDRRLRLLLAEGRPLIRADLTDTGGSRGAGVTVAVVDTGVDYDNNNLGAGCFGDFPLADPLCTVATSKVRGGYDFYHDDPFPKAIITPLFGEFSHGTAVAGIVAADGVDNTPPSVRGVAPDAQLVALQVCVPTACRPLESEVSAALDWILDNPSMEVRVVNMSLGTTDQINDPSVFPCSGSLTADAIAALTANGVAVVVASGNFGYADGISFPACVADAIAVGATFDADIGPYERVDPDNPAFNCTDPTTSARQVTCYTSFDELVDVVAPSQTTATTDFGENGHTDRFGGTSAASPYTAGAAALAIEANPSLTPAQLRTALIASAQTASFDPRSGLHFPFIDALALTSPPAGSCGDGVVAPLRGEQCDDGGTVDGDGCSADCQFEPATQGEDQQACLKTMYRNLGRVAKAQGGVVLDCIKNFAKGKLTGTAEACLTADARGKVAKAEARSVSDEADKCAVTPPDFGFTDATTSNLAATGSELDLVHDAFGTDLDAALVDEAVDRRTSRCQQGVAKAVRKCQKTRLDEFNRCQTARSRAGLTARPRDLERCIDADARAKTRKSCGAAAGKIRKRIDGGKCRDVDLGLAFPGCGTSDPAALAACLERTTACRACLAVNDAGALARSCDLYDDLAVNGSCP